MTISLSSTLEVAWLGLFLAPALGRVLLPWKADSEGSRLMILGVISGSIGWNSLDSGSSWSLRLTRVTLPPWVMLVTNLFPLAGSCDLLLLTGLLSLLPSLAVLLATLLADLLRAPILTTEP